MSHMSVTDGVLLREGVDLLDGLDHAIQQCQDDRGIYTQSLSANMRGSWDCQVPEMLGSCCCVTTHEYRVPIYTPSRELTKLLQTYFRRVIRRFILAKILYSSQVASGEVSQVSEKKSATVFEVQHSHLMGNFHVLGRLGTKPGLLIVRNFLSINAYASACWTHGVGEMIATNQKWQVEAQT